MNMEERFNLLFNEVKKEVQGLLPYPNNIYGKINTFKAIRTLGRCKKNSIYFQILLNEYMNGCTDQEIKNTLAHELIHTCPYCFNHGKNFKFYAEFLNRKLGYNIRTKSNCENFRNNRPKPKYTLICKECGKEHHRYRKLQYHIDMYQCKCGGKLKIIENK